MASPLKYSALLALAFFFPLHGIARSPPGIETTCEGVHVRKTMLAELLCRTGTGSFTGSRAVGNSGQSGGNLMQAPLYFPGGNAPGVG
jgi:hypothetical protein